MLSRPFCKPLFQETIDSYGELLAGHFGMTGDLAPGPSWGRFERHLGSHGTSGSLREARAGLFWSVIRPLGSHVATEMRQACDRNVLNIDA